MAHRVISLKYRPQNFDELTGQDHIVFSLKGAIRSGRIGHAFLFAGPRGVGKTTTARILAKSLNCENGPTVEPCQKCTSCREITLSRSIDVVEIDGASNRGIEEIRNLREGVKYSPIHGRYKIYIIDEVHMLTQEAFNALLKTLEEPPPKVIFIFATTNPMKVPATILSRCQRFVFKRLSLKEISSRLALIAGKENLKITENALHYIAIRADGSIRDGESILEQLASFVEGEITEKDVFQLIGFLSSNFYFDILKGVVAGDLKQVILLLNKGIEDGADPLEIYRGFTNFTRAALLFSINLPDEFVELNAEESELLRKMSLSKSDIINILEVCLRFEELIRRSVNIRIALELLFSQLVLIFSETGRRTRENEAEKIRNSGSEENGDVNSNDPGDRIFKKLQKISPKLAGIIHKAEIKKIDDRVNILVDNEFSKKQLIDYRKKIEAVLQELFGSSVKLHVEVVEKQKVDNDLVKSIKVLFDGEEIR